MKAEITIEFRKILGQKFNETAQLNKSTKETINKMCILLKKYFSDKFIETDITFKLK